MICMLNKSVVSQSQFNECGKNCHWVWDIGQAINSSDVIRASDSKESHHLGLKSLTQVSKGQMIISHNYEVG